MEEVEGIKPSEIKISSIHNVEAPRLRNELIEET